MVKKERITKKILIVFYSRTGNTKKIAEEIAKELNAYIDEIQDLKNRKGIIGYIVSGFDTIKNKKAEILTKRNPKEYGLIIIGTPVWVSKTIPPIRAYIEKYKEELKSKNKKIAFFCTMGGSGGKSVFKDMQELIGKKPIAELELLEKEIKSNNYKEKIKNFCSKLR